MNAEALSQSPASWRGPPLQIGQAEFMPSSRRCKFGGRPALALSEPDWFGSVARRLSDRTGEHDVLFPSDDVFGFERTVGRQFSLVDCISRGPPIRTKLDRNKS